MTKTTTMKIIIMNFLKIIGTTASLTNRSVINGNDCLVVFKFKFDSSLSLIIKFIVTLSKKQEQKRVVVGPGNAHCISIRHVSLLRGTCTSPFHISPFCSVARRRCCCCCI